MSKVRNMRFQIYEDYKAWVCSKDLISFLLQSFLKINKQKIC